MATKIMVVGPSGSGKTESLRTLDPTKTAIVCPDKKNLPFRGWRKNYKIVGEDGKFDPATCNFYKSSDWSRIRGYMKYISEKRPEIKTEQLACFSAAPLTTICIPIFGPTSNPCENSKGGTSLTPSTFHL